MKQPETPEQMAAESASGNSVAAPAASAARVLAAQGCPTCGAAPATNGTLDPSYVYAIGRIEARFPRPSVEKEFAQATGRVETAGLTDRQAVQKLLSQRANRYLARQLCWVMTIEGLESYIVIPHDPADLDLLVESLRGAPSPMDLDCVIGPYNVVWSGDAFLVLYFATLNLGAPTETTEMRMVRLVPET